MNETRWERYGAGAGIGFVVLFLLSIFVVPLAPHIDASTGKIMSYVGDHRRGLLTATLFNSLASLAFLWFCGHLRHVLQRSEHQAEAFSPMVFGAGVLTAGAALLSLVPMTTLAFMAGRPNDPSSAAVVRMLFDMNWLFLSVVGFAFGLFTIALSSAMLRRELATPSFGYLGMLSAALIWIFSIGSLYVTHNSTALNTVALIGYLGFAAWMLLTSVAMYQRPEVERASTHSAVFA